MRIGELNGQHISTTITLRGGGEELWSWEVKALLGGVEHHVQEDHARGLEKWTRITVLLKINRDDRAVSIDLPSTHEIDEPERVRG